MNESDFEILIENGNTGFYQSCEVTQFFIQDKESKAVTNLFILASFEDKPFVDRNHSFLTSKKGINIDDSYNLGIQRYYLSIDETRERFKTLNKDSEWNYNGDTSLKLGKLNGLTKQFIPSREGQRINHILKNNFHNGSYILEFFDESKNHVDFLLDMKKIKLLNQLSEEIKKIVPIDLSVLRDRIGNIIFQFPITTLNTRSKALPTWDGVELKFKWSNRFQMLPDCLIQVESIIDKNYMGSTVVEYNLTEKQQIFIGNLDQVNHIKIWKKNPSLLLSTFDGTYIREFHLNTGIISHEPRIFEIAGKEQKVAVSSKGMTTGKKESINYTTYINNTLYEAEKLNLEKTLSFKQYFKGDSKSAFEDIKTLVTRNDKNGVYLWDPYLTSEDILRTLFFSPTNGVPLKAIKSNNDIPIPKKKISPFKRWLNLLGFGNKKQRQTNSIASKMIAERSKLDNPIHNNYGINLEFRMQHSQYGWTFHDRFLIFPGSKETRPKVYSLGTSVNSLGFSHHILQEISHPQRVIDAFEELWEKLNNEDCLIWKYPKN
ncbi:VPA1262 family N-terminal domain-containing protein [Salinimicrobium sp. WS361]|uniref:VPA1262 family N-terminal domain-containing protein n=1 Tax=Salinimicrobium sp. WS361 TaxID=3425123 RepID=UPI003D6E8E40